MTGRRFRGGPGRAAPRTLVRQATRVRRLHIKATPAGSPRLKRCGAANRMRFGRPTALWRGRAVAWASTTAATTAQTPRSRPKAPAPPPSPRRAGQVLPQFTPPAFKIRWRRGRLSAVQYLDRKGIRPASRGWQGGLPAHKASASSPPQVGRHDPGSHRQEVDVYASME